MFPSLSPPSSIPSRSRVQVQVQVEAPPSPFAFNPDTETLYADPWHAQTSSLATPTSTWSPEYHPTSSSSSSEHSSPTLTPTSPVSGSEHQHQHQHETTKKSTRKNKSTNNNTNTNTNTASSKSKRSKSSDPAQKMVLGKTGKPILAASLKRQLRRQKARARAEPRYIELADGQKLGLGQRRSKYTAILEKLNQDLARVQNELSQEKQRNQHLDQTVQQLSQQLNQQTCASASTELQPYHTALQIQSQLMHQYSTQSIYDFFKMSSPVMLVLIDFNLRVIDANQTFLRENGWTRDELIGRRSPIVHMTMFFIPGYDQRQIPIDENDIPPLHGGLPRGIPVEEMHVKPANYPVFHNLYRGKADSINVRDTYLDGKGRLYKSSVTHWLAYYNPEDNNNNNNNPNPTSNLPADTARFASDIHTSMMRSESGSDSASSYVYSRPTTKADEAFRELFGKPNPPYLPNKGYPKYHVAMESAYDREYLCSSSIREADSESDSDDEHIHQQDHTQTHTHTPTHIMPSTNTTQPLHTIANIADQFTAWRRTLRTNRTAIGTSMSTPVICIDPPNHTSTTTSGSGSGSNSSGCGSLTVPSTCSSSSSSSSCLVDDESDDDLVLPSSINPVCAPSDACAIVSVLVEKAKKVTSIRKMVQNQVLQEPAMEEDGGDGGNGNIQSTTQTSIATCDRINTNTQHNHIQMEMSTSVQPSTLQPQVQVQVPVPVSIPVHTPVQTSHQPSTPFPPSPSPYSPLDLPLSTPSSSLSSSSSFSSLPLVYNSDPDQDMLFPSSSSLTLTSQSSYESQTRTTFPFRAPSPFSIWGN